MRLDGPSSIAIVGTLIAVSYATATRLGPKPRERLAAEALAAIVEAQETFRATGGRGRYATTLESLATPCPGGEWMGLETDSLTGRGYVITLRARQPQPTLARAASPDAQGPKLASLQAASVVDCHGRPTAADFVASAAPIRAGIDGLRALSTTSTGRIVAFFDGVAPTEIDMAPGGLAMPLDNPRPIP